MQKLTGFKQSDPYQIDAINELIDAVLELQSDRTRLASTVRELKETFATKAEVERLRVRVDVLIQLLVERQLVDTKLLEYRSEAALLERTPAVEPASMPRDPRNETLDCARCGARVSLSETYVTEQGSVCARCFAAER